MDVTFNTILVLLPVLYTVLVMAYARIFARKPGGLALFVRPLLLVTVLLHFVVILIRGLVVGGCPLGSQAEILALIALSIAVIYLFLEFRIRDRTTGIFVIIAVFLLQLVASVNMLTFGPQPQAELGWWESLHAFAAIAGLSAVAVSGIYGLLYLSLYGAIKAGRFGLFFVKMPPLEKLSLLNYGTVWIGFLALTVTVGTGAMLWRSAAAPGDGTWWELVFTGVLWLMLGLCIVAMRFWRLGAKRLAYSTVVCFALVIGILAVGLIPPGVHG